MVLSFKKIINQINENLYSCSIESGCRFKCLIKVIFRKFTFVTNKFDQNLVEQLLKPNIFCHSSITYSYYCKTNIQFKILDVPCL